MYRKKEKNRFAGWAAAFMFSAFFMGFSGCGQEKAVVLETLSFAGGEESGGPESQGMEREPDGWESGPEKEADPALEPEIQVHVCGAVNEPGVYALPAGSRVFEAVDMAGGMAAEAAADYLNLAEAVFDGARVRVPFLSEVSGDGACGTDAAFGVTGNRGENSPGAADGDWAAGPGGLVDLNYADRETLMALPGIGEAKAEAILSWREEHGAFGKPEDIMQVPGIKEAAYEKLKDKITVGN